MRVGIKQKILLVLVGVLAFTTALHALLASYYTNQQNQESAFAALDRDLLAWHNDLQAQTQRLQIVALSAAGDAILLNQLAELVTLELNVDDPLRAKEAPEMARTLSFSKSVSLNRLHLVLQTGGFSSIAIYTNNKLSHYVSTADAGMTIRRGNARLMWIVSNTSLAGEGSFQSWPAWQEGSPSSTVAHAIADVKQPTISFVFLSPDLAAIDIAVPMQGTIEEFMRNDAAIQPLSRYVFELAIADPARNAAKGASSQRPTTFAVLVFRKLIDRTALEDLAAKTGKWPVLFSPDGSHQQRLADFHQTPKELLQQAQAASSGKTAQVIRQTVTTDRGSFYETLLPLRFENQTRLILGLTSSRDSTLQNIRQTVGAILIAASLILVLSVVVGVFWVGRLINPIIVLTNAVKQIGIKQRLGNEQPEGNRIAAEQLHPITIEAPDEIGELGSSFNVMIAELRHSLETLEQRVQARTAELRQQTLYLRTLIDTLPLWVWLKDTERRYLTTNQANADACGHMVEEMIGKSDQELWPPERAERYRADDMEVMTSHQRKTVEEPIAGVNGIVWMEIYRAPVLDEDGTVLGTVGVARNISERRAAEAAREAALAEAVRLAQQRSAFLAQMSHELRTPLNSILGYAQILERDPALDETHTAKAKVIRKSGEHLLTLINDILDLARIEAGKMELYPDELLFQTFVQDLIDIAGVKAAQKGLALVCDLDPAVPPGIRADGKRLRQVLLNLLSNAVKFTDRGQVVLRVRFAPPDQWRFEVADTGVGIAADQLQTIFEPFEQAGDRQHRAGGSGLGLTISRQYARLMGGDIRVESRPGQGSTFHVEIQAPPLDNATEAPMMAERASVRNVTGYAGPRKKVLVVDDIAENRAVAIDLLTPLGFAVSEAANGREGLEAARRLRPDLILMDIAMPQLDGLAATRLLRQSEACRELPVIAVSASVSASDVEQCLAAGMNAFLPKPLDADKLLDQMARLLQLEWTYRAAPAPTPAEAGAMVALPAEEMDVLYRLARLGNMHEIMAQADRLASLEARYRPFAERLMSLARGYQSKAVLQLVEAHREGSLVSR